MQFISREVAPRSVWNLEQAGVHPLLARLYAARGIHEAHQLDTSLAQLLPPSGLKGIAQAAELLADAIASNKNSASLLTMTAMARQLVQWQSEVCGC